MLMTVLLCLYPDSRDKVSVRVCMGVSVCMLRVCKCDW